MTYISNPSLISSAATYDSISIGSTLSQLIRLLIQYQPVTLEYLKHSLHYLFNSSIYIYIVYIISTDYNNTLLDAIQRKTNLRIIRITGKRFICRSVPSSFTRQAIRIEKNIQLSFKRSNILLQHKKININNEKIGP